MESDRKAQSILKIVAEMAEPVGSSEIAEKLKKIGIEISERTVRYYLKNLSEKGLVKIFWKEGRMITKKGEEELSNSMVAEKVGLVSARIESMSYLMDFDLQRRFGRLILNISLFHKSEFNKALKIMRQIFDKNLGMGNRVLIAEGGERIDQLKVPSGKIALGTLCTINLNGILLKAGIPMDSKFGGVLQIKNGKPWRFTELISYSGSTLDPHEIFIRSKMTSVREAAKGSGKILAGLREIPVACKEKVEKLLRECEEAGLGRALYVGKIGQPVLGMPVGIERVGLVIPGGLNPVAAAEEGGIQTDNKALAVLVDYKQLQRI